MSILPRPQYGIARRRRRRMGMLRLRRDVLSDRLMGLNPPSQICYNRTIRQQEFLMTVEMTHGQTIIERTWNGSQSWWYERIFKLRVGRKGHKLRTTIRHNAYRAQSYAKIERWTGSTWRAVHIMPGESLRSILSYCAANVNVSNFERTGQPAELLQVAREIL
jgi:hypothetical protein